MILTGSEITKNVLAGKIFLEPFDKSLVNPNSYNYRLGDILLVSNNLKNATEGIGYKRIKIPPTGYTLKPKRLYLGSTFETIGSTSFVPSLIGRSSLGRLGLFLQITADLGHIGTKHKWTLELAVVQPLKIYPGMRIGQVSFWKPDNLRMLKGQSYANTDNSYSQFSEPQPAMQHKLFKQ